MKLKEKKELRSLPTAFVKKFLGLEFKKARKLLREVYGGYKLHGYEKRWKLLEYLKGINDYIVHEKILRLHRSTRERLGFYDFIYKKIFSITGKPKTILDLGCGLNPFSIPWMNIKGFKYYAVELTNDDADFIAAYFKKLNIAGKVYALDITEINQVRTLPKVDVCLLFKMLDILETIKLNISSELLAAIKARYTVVSFPKKTFSGKPISTKRLKWFETLLSDKQFTVFEIPNERFYIIKNY